MVLTYFLRAKDIYSTRLIRKAIDTPEASLSAELMLRSWSRYSLHSGIRTTELKRIVGHLQAWINAELSFEEVDNEVRFFVGRCIQSRMRSGELFALRQVFSSYGFFSGSAPLLKHGAYLVARESAVASSTRDLRRRLRAALALGDVETFVDGSRDLARINGGSSTDEKFIHLARLLADSRDQFEEPEVVVIGPSELDESALKRHSASVRARVLIPGESAEIMEIGLDQPTSILYANGETTEWLATVSSEHLARLADAGVIFRLKKRLPATATIPNSDQVIRSRDLFLTGNPNLVPMMILDLILRGFTKIFVTGANFWFGPIAYREDQRRFRLETEMLTDSFGSMGGTFERCRGLASHDQVVNMNVIRTLVSAKTVSGDKNFLEALNVSEGEYLKHLDLVYGRARR